MPTQLQDLLHSQTLPCKKASSRVKANHNLKLTVKLPAHLQHRLSSHKCNLSNLTLAASSKAQRRSSSTRTSSRTAQPTAGMLHHSLLLIVFHQLSTCRPQASTPPLLSPATQFQPLTCQSLGWAHPQAVPACAGMSPALRCATVPALT